MKSEAARRKDTQGYGKVAVDDRRKHAHRMSGDMRLVTETDVRERVIWPLLARLGYTPAMITTERSLVHKFVFLGHKKPKSDRPLRGKADYVCEVDGRLNFVIDAKKPGPITNEDRQQTYSYAAHAEIHAVAFAIISGTHFEVFLTQHRPEAGPVLEFSLAEAKRNFQRLANIVSPDALVREFPNHIIDVGVPLAAGLRSFAKVERGKQTYTDLPASQAARLGSSVHYTDGSVVRAAG